MAGAPRELPDYLLPVHDFVNTVDVEDGTDILTTPAELTEFLSGQQLLNARTAATRADLRLALELRQALRALALANHPGTELPAADAALAARCFGRLPLLGGVDALSPGRGRPVQQALASLVARYATARATGEWQRLRRCPADDCAWVFWDSSPRGARRWCTMSVCGNRAKARTYAARHTPTHTG